MKLNFSKSTNIMLTSITGVLLVLGSSNLLAADGKEAAKAEIVKDTKVIAKAPADDNFKTLDGDSDGKISLKEAAKDPVLLEQFGKTDVNKDGSITVEEYAMFASSADKATAVN